MLAVLVVGYSAHAVAVLAVLLVVGYFAHAVAVLLSLVVEKAPNNQKTNYNIKTINYTGEFSNHYS